MQPILRIAFFLVCFGFAHGQDGCTSPATLTGNGTFGSANPYSNYQKCRWLLDAESGKAIQLSFNGRFNIEPSSSCSYDRLVIFDSDAVDAVLKGSVCASSSLALSSKFGPYCGLSAPADDIISSGSQLVVEFCSDSSSVGSGFEIEHKEVKASPAPNAGSDCNLDLIVDKQQLVTFYNNTGYPAFVKCNYRFTSKSGRPLKVTANRFHLEGFLGCRYDSVKIFEQELLVGTFCGLNGPKEVRSKGNQIRLEFTSDQYTNGKGFSLLVEESCQGAHLCSKVEDSRDDECYEDGQTCDGNTDCQSGQDESACDGCGSAAWVGKVFAGAAAITHIDGQIHCGGALINKQFVLTAAHCFHRLNSTPERFVVKLGAAKLADAYVSQIKSIIIHPMFNPKTLANNLALIRLAKPAPLQSTISPLCIPSSGALANFPVGSQCFTVGWGRTVAQDITSYAKSVKNLTASIVVNSQCKFTASPVVVNDSNICASTSGKLCYGDNGAPLVCKASNSKWQIAGVNSVAFGCSSTSNIPSSFTKVYSYLSWINDNAFN